VEAGRRAGMRVVWVPHPELAAEYRGREKEVLAGRIGLVEGSLSGKHNSRRRLKPGLVMKVTAALFWPFLTWKLRAGHAGHQWVA
jgi:hypothetical protein